jgi:hypothetical protein
MSSHETTTCPRCEKAFECKPGNITQCQCYGIELAAELKDFIEQRFKDCLCLDCLEYLQQNDLSKEK